MNLTILAFLVISFYCLPLILLGENSYILVHDNLDSVFVYYKTLASQDLFFSDSSKLLQGFGKGIPREVLPGEWSLVSLLFYFFKPINAYILNFIFQHFVAFFSMRKFLSLFTNSSSPAVVFASLSFALLPFWPFGAGTIPLMPVVLWAFISVLRNQNVYFAFSIALIVPFYSSFYLAAMFLSLLMYLYLTIEIFRRRFHLRAWLLVSLQVLVYLLVDYRLVWHVLSKSFVSQRVDMITSTAGFSFQQFVDLFLHSHYHAFSGHHLVILPASLFALGCWLFKRVGNSHYIKMISCLLFTALILSLLSLFWKLPVSDFLRQISLIKMIKLQRVYFLFPFVWTMVFFFTLMYFHDQFNKLFVWILISFQIAFLFFNSDFVRSFREEHISFSEFYATDEMPKLISKIEPSVKDDAKFMAIGFHPSVLSYHDLKTLDFYIPHYPLKYKKVFIDFVRDELALNPKIDRYIREQGVRLYFYSHEIGIFGGAKRVTCPAGGMVEPRYNFALIREFGGRFFISACPVKGWNPISQIVSKAYKHLYLYDISGLPMPHN